MRPLKRILSSVAIISAVTLLLTSCSLPVSLPENIEENTEKTLQKPDDGEISVHFLDVGQGDCEFVQLPNGETILIDGGESVMGDRVVENISAIGYDEITYLVATHPHSDHIGGLCAVLDAFEVQNVYMPDASSESDYYGNFLQTVYDENCKVLRAKSGVSIIDSEDLSVYFIAPVSSSYSEENNFSAVLRIEYGENSFMFMGDAETLVENELSGDVSADVIKVGHHGSSTSSSENFVNRVDADFAVIECGENSYGQPNGEVVERWESSGADVYRTDEYGNITFVGNGETLEVITEFDNAQDYETANAA